MKKFVLIPLFAILVFSGCTSNSTEPSSKVSKVKEEIETKKLNLLGVEFEWQEYEANETKSWNEALEYCKNQNGMHLPSPDEFFALIDTNMSINEIFPSDTKEFWTSRSYDDNRACKISTWSTTSSYVSKERKLGVRCVKGSIPHNHEFKKDSNSGLVLDKSSDKNSYWLDSNDTRHKALTYTQAQNFCKSNKMRLPTLFELLQISDAEFENIAKDDFLSYWTSTPLPTDSGSVMSVDFKNSLVGFSDKKEINHIMCMYTKVDFNTPIYSVKEGEVYSFKVIDSKDVILKPLKELPKWLKLENSLLTGIPKREDVGDYFISILANDGNNEFVLNYTLNVEIVPTILSAGKYISDKIFLSTDDIIDINISTVWSGDGVHLIDVSLKNDTIGDVSFESNGMVHFSPRYYFRNLMLESDYNATLKYTIEDLYGNQSFCDIVIPLQADAKITKILPSGQVKSYNSQGIEDASVQDDGYFNNEKKNSIISVGGYQYDNSTGLYWQDTNISQMDYTQAQKYCKNYSNSSGWRVPEIEELLTIVDYSKSDYLTDGLHHNGSLLYWSNTSDQNGQLWYMDFNSSKISLEQLKSTKKSVRCVKGGVTSAKSKFIKKSGYVLDVYHNLEWEDYDKHKTALRWDEAIGYCKNLDLNGTGWRLPNINELVFSKDYNAFKMKDSGYFWSATSAKDKKEAFLGGVEVSLISDLKSSVHNYRCIRGNKKVILRDDFIETGEDADVRVDVLQNDTAKSYNSTLKLIEAKIVYGRGVVSIDSNEKILFSPNKEFEYLSENETAEVIITYKAEDIQTSQMQESNLTIVVNGINDAPVIKSFDNLITYQNQETTGKIVATDSDGSVRYRFADEVNSSLFSIDEISGEYRFNPKDKFDYLKKTESTHFSIIVIVSDMFNEIEQSIKVQVNGKNDKPIAIIDMPTDITESDSVVFNASMSSDKDGDTLTYEWYLDEPSESFTGESFTKQNLIAGTHTITLSVSDGTDTVSASKVFTVLQTKEVVKNLFDTTPKYIQQVTTTAGGIKWLEASDIDNDGDMDIVGYTDAQLFLYENQGDYSFSKNIIVSESINSAYIADLNLDGVKEIIYANDSLGICFDNKHDKKSSCTEIYSGYLADDNITDIAVNDIDSQNGVDIITTSYRENTINIFTQDSKGRFSYNSTLSETLEGGTSMSGTLKGAVSLDSADIDSDGVIELISAGRSSGEINLYKINTTFGFDKVNLLYQSLVDSLRIADLDKQSDLDIVIGTSDGKIYWHNIDANKTELVSSDFDLATHTIEADIDGDDYIDIVPVTNTTDNKLVWYKNNTQTDAAFSKSVIMENISDVQALAVTDMNGDGYVDIVTGDRSGYIKIYEHIKDQ